MYTTNFGAIFVLYYIAGLELYTWVIDDLPIHELSSRPNLLLYPGLSDLEV